MKAKKGKILVVDDEQGMRDMLSYELSEQGYAVITAPDGESALKILFMTYGFEVKAYLSAEYFFTSVPDSAPAV